MKVIIRCVGLLVFCLSEAHAQQVFWNDIVINEILFNPPKDGYDYIEGYNRSGKIIDLADIFVANRNSTGDIASKKPVSRLQVLVQPGYYFVVTANEKWLRKNYNIPESAVICQVTSMPSFPDNEGIAIFLNKDDSIIDEIAYNAKWHFPMIADPSGVSLERINYNLSGQNGNNWTSASSACGYGTPGFKNSQYQEEMIGSEEITVTPRVFSPDNDGVNDVARIELKMNEPGFMANTTVYDLSGRKVRYLLKNESIGLSAQYKWDGLDEKSQPLSQGIYIIITELYNLKGKVKKFKNSIVLSRK